MNYKNLLIYFFGFARWDNSLPCRFVHPQTHHYFEKEGMPHFETGTLGGVILLAPLSFNAWPMGRCCMSCCAR